MNTEQRYEKIFTLHEINLEEAQVLSTSKDFEDMKIAHNKISDLIAQLRRISTRILK